MNHACPHCDRPTIPWAAKMYSVPYAPAKCPSCGGFSAEPYGATLAIRIFLGVGSWIALFAAIAWFSPWPIATFIVVIGAACFAANRWLPLMPITAEAFRDERRLRWATLGAIVVVVAIIGFAANY